MDLDSQFATAHCVGVCARISQPSAPADVRPLPESYIVQSQTALARANQLSSRLFRGNKSITVLIGLTG